MLETKPQRTFLEDLHISFDRLQRALADSDTDCEFRESVFDEIAGAHPDWLVERIPGEHCALLLFYGGVYILFRPSPDFPGKVSLIDQSRLVDLWKSVDVDLEALRSGSRPLQTELLPKLRGLWRGAVRSKAEFCLKHHLSKNSALVRLANLHGEEDISEIMSLIDESRLLHLC